MIPLMIPLNLGKRKNHSKQDQGNRGVVPLSQELLNIRLTQFGYFSDIRKSSVIIFQTCSADLRSFEQSIDDRHILPALPIRCWPQSCLLKASRSWCHLSPPLKPLLSSFTTQKKNVCATWCNLHILAEAFLVFITESFPTWPNISGLFVPRTTWKRGGVNKSMW